MNKRMGIPEGLHVEEKDIPQMVEWALARSEPDLSRTRTV